MVEELPQINPITAIAPPTYPALIDCPYEGVLRTRMKFNFAWVGIVAAILFLLLVVVPNEPLIGFVLMLISIFVVLLVGYFLTDRDRRAILDPALGIPTADAIRTALTPRWYHTSWSLAWVSQSLTRLGCRGVTARLGKSKLLVTVLPLEEVFEPIPLDESGDLFNQLSDDTADAKNETVQAPSAFARNLKLGGGWLALIGCSVPLCMGIIESVRLKRITFPLIQWSVFMLLIVMGFGRGAFTSRLQLFLVPAGLVIRRSRLWKDNWRIERYTRDHSVLVVQHQQQSIWRAYVADSKKHAKAAMTQREAHMLLRAWLSPHPAPPDAQLSDLA